MGENKTFDEWLDLIVDTLGVTAEALTSHKAKLDELEARLDELEAKLEEKP